eukprot:gene11710-4944_t
MNEEYSTSEQLQHIYTEEEINASPLNQILKDIDNFKVTPRFEESEEIKIEYDITGGYDITLSNEKSLISFESSECLQRNCCGPLRSLKNHLYSNNEEFMSLERPFSLFFQEMFVYDETMIPKRFIGSVKTKFKLFTREFLMLNSENEEIYHITGNIFSPWTFEIYKKDLKLGVIEKKFSFQELCSDSNNFGAEFSNEFSVDDKALTIGATFLIELMYFEQRKLK